MDAWLTEDQISLRGGLREVLDSACTPSVVRTAWEKGISAREPRLLWQTLAELGLFGLIAPEELGGGGAGEVELAVLMEECGRYAVPGPVLEHIAVGVPALVSHGGHTAAEAIAGRTMVTAQEPGSGRVPWAEDADLVVAVRPDSVVFAERSDVRVMDTVESVDKSRRLHTASLERTTDLPGADPGTLANRAALAAAAQLLGLADHLIRTTVEYVRVRHQFGVAIGSQRPVQHHLASVYVELSHARPVVYDAAFAMATGREGVDRDVSFAKVYAHRAAHSAARAALQCHGAIGYTWEHDLQLWMKRVWALGSVWGTDTYHHDRVSEHVLDSASAGTREG